MTSAAPLTPVLNAMSIDVEDYFHANVFDGIVLRHHWETIESRVCANTDRLLQILSDAGVLSTFFVLGWVGNRFPELVRRIADLGHEIASHGFAHRRVYDQTRTAFREDVRRAKSVLEQAAGVQVGGFRAPSYSVTYRSMWALDVLVQEGYWYDASVFPIKHDRYGIPGAPRHPHVFGRQGIVEVPASTVRINAFNLPVAGGGYFRLLPYAWTRWGISRLNRVEQRPAIFYLHPWELDWQQPRVQVGVVNRIRHYRNLKRTESRFRRLLQDFRFTTIAAMLQALPPHEVFDPASIAVPCFQTGAQ